MISDRRVSTRLRLLAGAGLSLCVVLGASGAAGAHVEPEVKEVPTGAEATVVFTPEHDCEGSPTVRVEIKVPEGVTGVAAVEKEGWTSSVEDGVVSFDWGGTDGASDEGFGVTFTPPDTVGETLLFPTIQTCAEGQIDWIQPSASGERPAPRVVVVQGTAQPTTTEPPGSSTTAPADDPTTTADGAADTDTTTTGVTSDEGSSDDSSSSPWVLGIGVVAVIAIVGGVVIMRRRSSS